jgi:Ca2+-binding EF-hand superfamily protein
MGNHASTNNHTSSKLYLIALARKMSLSKVQVRELMKMCIYVAHECHFQSFTIDRESFHQVKASILSDPTDSEIMDLLFTMWDLSGLQCIQFREFLVGMSPLASTIGDSTRDILHFSLSLMDTAGIGAITQSNLVKVLRSINATASFLGDNVLTNSEIEIIGESVFRTKATSTTSSVVRILKHDTVIHSLIMHPYIQKFIHGKGSHRYRVPKPKDLENYVKKKKRKGSDYHHHGRKCYSAPKFLYEC